MEQSDSSVEESSCLVPWSYIIYFTLLWHDIAFVLKASLDNNQPTTNNNFIMSYAKLQP